MATILEILNVVQCGLGNPLGTGTVGCKASLKKKHLLYGLLREGLNTTLQRF